jgi:hypothetical protein
MLANARTRLEVEATSSVELTFRGKTALAFAFTACSLAWNPDGALTGLELDAQARGVSDTSVQGYAMGRGSEIRRVQFGTPREMLIIRYPDHTYGRSG